MASHLPEHIWDYIFSLEHKMLFHSSLERINVWNEFKTAKHEADALFGTLNWLARSQNSDRETFDENVQMVKDIAKIKVPSKVVEMMMEASNLKDVLARMPETFRLRSQLLEKYRQ